MPNALRLCVAVGPVEYGKLPREPDLKSESAYKERFNFRGAVGI